MPDSLNSYSVKWRLSECPAKIQVNGENITDESASKINDAAVYLSLHIDFLGRFRNYAQTNSGDQLIRTGRQ